MKISQSIYRLRSVLFSVLTIINFLNCLLWLIENAIIYLGKANTPYSASNTFVRGDKVKNIKLTTSVYYEDQIKSTIFYHLFQ